MVAADDDENVPPINHFVTPAEMLKIGLLTRGYTRRRIKRCKSKTNIFRFKQACCVLAQYRIENEIPLYDILIEDVVNKYNNDKKY